ncbi:MAG TPA: MMPL family transporter, partial [Solirubrobacterales bacterium]|nr:MMPL family transporter [Solirubrobacterales bacterium]
MRRFASWTTSHRAIVIIGWLATLVVVGIIAGVAGSNFSEEFSLPSSDSKDALDLLENRFPAQAGDTVQIVYKAESGVKTAAVKQKMEGVFNRVQALPHVSEVSSPYEKGGAGAVSDDGKIAYATAQFNVTTDKLNDGEVKKIMDTAQAAGGDGLQVELGGSPVEEVRGEEEEGSSEMIGVLAAIIVLLISFGSVVAMGLPI